MLRLLLFTAVISFYGCATGDYIGAEYLGLPYKDNPLGEGTAPDSDPLVRYDAFDCVTFVETVLAGGDVTKLNKIRYADGNPTFVGRNHFIETDWLENNASIVENASAKYANTAIRHVTIDKKKWFKRVHHMDTDFDTRSADLEYIPYANAHNITVQKPVIVLFIIDSPKIRDKIGTDLAVRHMGILLPNGRLRHASQIKGRVVDTNFHKYINRLLENKNNLGIMLLDIKQ